MFKKILVSLFLSMFLFQPFQAPLTLAQEKKAPDAPKEKYKVIGDLKEAAKIHPIEVVKYFNYSCGHCYRFFKGEKRLVRFGRKIHLKKIPVFWGQQTPFPAMAYYLALREGKGVEVNKAIFEASFEQDLDVFDPAVLNQIILEYGLPMTINGKDWTQSTGLKDQVMEGIKLADQFDVHETPSVVINNAIKVMPVHTKGNMAKMVERVEEAINDLSR